MIILFFVLKLFIYFTGERFLKSNFLKKIFNGLLFEAIISLTLEGFLEFIIYSFLNIYTKDFSINGEVLGFIVSIVCLYLATIFVPIALIWAICTKNEAQLDNEEFKEIWNPLFEFINIKKLSARFYNLIFILRRFLVIGLFLFYNISKA